MRCCSSAAAATSFKLLAGSAVAGKEVGRGRGVICSHGADFRNTQLEVQIGSFRLQGLGCGGGGGGGGSASSRGNLPRLVIVRRSPIHAVASSSSSPSPSSEFQVELEPTVEEQTQLPDQDDSRMVHLKMQLQKKCQFGEHFLLVGAQSMLGLWNPLDAVPMTWSDGHVWTVELDVPLGEPVQFKFILRKITGEFLWQPGQDRVLHTWETSNIITVLEDWENAEAQQVKEELVIHNKYEESDEASESADSVAYSNGQTVGIVADNITYHIDPDMDRMGSSSMASEGEIFTVHNEKPPFPVVDNVTYQIQRSVEIPDDEVVAENNIPLAIKDAVAVSNKGLMTSECSLEIDEFPVLVPGMNPCSTSPSKDVTAKEKQVEVKLDISSKGNNAKHEEPAVDQNQEVEGHLEKEEATGSLILNDGHALIEHPNQLAINNNEEVNNKPDQRLELAFFEGQNDTKSTLWHNDIKWGKGTLKKILNFLGFL